MPLIKSAPLCEHGDAVHFPQDWNNPTHEQLRDLIENNGSLSLASRRQIKTNLVFLRRIREDADYRPGVQMDRDIALRCLRFATSIFVLLSVDE